MRLITATLIAVAIVATTLAADTTEEDLQNDLRKLDVKYVSIKLQLLKAYKMKFEALRDIATRKGDLDLALKMRNRARELEAQINKASFTSPMPTEEIVKPQPDNDTSATKSDAVKIKGYTCCQVGAVKVTSSSPSYAKEGPEKAFDGTSAKWNSKEKMAFVIFSFKARPDSIAAYAIESANAEQRRDPKQWCLYGSYNGRDWTLIDKQDNVDFPGRNATKLFKLTRPVTYAHYKFEILANHGDGNTQLAELHLLRR